MPTSSPKAADAAINRIASDGRAVVGQTYLETVSRIVDFGAFVRFSPGTDGLLQFLRLPIAASRTYATN